MTIILTYASLASPLFVLILGWKRRYSLLWLYAAVGLIIDNAGMILKTYGVKPYLFGDIFILCELFFVSFYYKNKIFHSKALFGTLFMTLAIGFGIHTLLVGFEQVNYLGAGILCIAYIVYGIAGYLRMLRSPELIDLNRSPFFWINTAFFIYATSNCLLFLFTTYLKQESFQLMMDIWFNFFVSINIIRYIFIGIGLYKTKPREA